MLLHAATLVLLMVLVVVLSVWTDGHWLIDCPVIHAVMVVPAVSRALGVELLRKSGVILTRLSMLSPLICRVKRSIRVIVPSSHHEIVPISGLFRRLIVVSLIVLLLVSIILITVPLVIPMLVELFGSSVRTILSRVLILIDLRGVRTGAQMVRVAVLRLGVGQVARWSFKSQLAVRVQIFALLVAIIILCVDLGMILLVDIVSLLFALSIVLATFLPLLVLASVSTLTPTS